MCGIYGIVDPSSRQIDRESVVRATNTMRHRGPDGEGFAFFDNVALGHRRLSIIDPDGGQQPISNEDGSVTATYNGEIYNFPELKKELESHGHFFKTNCDVEVLVHGYEQWGGGLLERLRGMFAFGIYDDRKARMLIARDRFGIKPLFYSMANGQLVFASEMKAILVGGAADWEIDYEAVADYFALGYVPAPKTIYKQIRRLDPSSFMSITTRGELRTMTETYYRLPDFGRLADEGIDKTKATLVDELRDAVGSHLLSDVPLGAYLSGGMDSASLVSMMTEVSNERVNTFTVDFVEDNYSEGEEARQIASHLGTNHTEFTVGPDPDLDQLIRRLVRQFDEPFGNASMINTYKVANRACQSVKVALSGEGGDEILAGYGRYLILQRQGSLDSLPQSLRRATSTVLSPIWPRRLPAAALIENLGLTPCQRYAQYFARQFGGFDSKDVLELPVSCQAEGAHQMLTRICGSIDGVPLERFLFADFNTYMPGDILYNADITSMMNSLEVRVPFLDHKFVEFVTGLNVSYKLRGGVSKFVLKEAMRDRLPGEILRRKKSGFGVPIRRWLAKDLRPFARHYLLESQRSSGLLDRKYVNDIVAENEKTNGNSTRAGRLWWLLAFEIWYQDAFGDQGL